MTHHGIEKFIASISDTNGKGCLAWVWMHSENPLLHTWHASKAS